MPRIIDYEDWMDIHNMLAEMKSYNNEEPPEEEDDDNMGQTS
jgi:hypothetical protein